VSGIVEKPLPDEAPSTLAVVGRYVLSGAIFNYLEKLGKGTGGEIQLTDGIAALMHAERVLAYRYAGQRYDCGSKLGYLKATAAMGLKHPETAAGFREFLQQMQLEEGAK
jgi:UTP--glucose-1-phosphate uridylyltransferase